MALCCCFACRYRTRSLDNLPWQATAENVSRASAQLQSIMSKGVQARLPSEVAASNILHVLANPGYLKTHDWHMMLGPLGKWLLYGVVPATYEAVLYPYLDVLGQLSAFELTRADMDHLALEVNFCLANMHMHVPEWYLNMNKHNIHHIAANIQQYGPSHAYSMWRREGLNGRLLEWMHNKARPEATIMDCYKATRVSLEKLGQLPEGLATLGSNALHGTATGEPVRERGVGGRSM